MLRLQQQQHMTWDGALHDHLKDTFQTPTETLPGSTLKLQAAHARVTLVLEAEELVVLLFIVTDCQMYCDLSTALVAEVAHLKFELDSRKGSQ